MLTWLWDPRTLGVLAVGSACASGALIAGIASGERPGERREGVTQPVREVERGASAEDAARDLSSLERALALPHHVALEALGPHRLRDRSEMRVRGDGDEPLVVETEITFARGGAFRARSESSAGYARDVVVADGQVYTRPGYGPYHRRPPETADEPRALADELASTPSSHAAALLPGAAIAGRGEVEHAGRRAVAIALGPGESGATIASAADWDADRAEVAHVRGEVVLDAETGALLAADVRGAVALTREGRRIELELAFSRKLTDFGAAGAIDVPAGDDVITLVGGAEPPGEMKPDGGSR